MHDSMYDDDLRAFRDSFCKFIDKEIKPFHAQWENDGVVSRAVWEKGGAAGFLCIPQSLIVVPSTAKGFVRGKKLEKIGMHAQDTSEMHFEDCRVPRDFLIGERGQGFVYLMKQLAQERLIIAIASVAGAAETLKHTI